MKKNMKNNSNPDRVAPIKLGALITDTLVQANAQEQWDIPLPSITKHVVMNTLLDELDDEVKKRGNTFQVDQELWGRMTQVATWLINDPSPFLIMCGKCGNGKTTMMRAIAGVVRLLLSRETLPVMREESATNLYRSMRYDHASWKSACHAPFLGIDDFGEEPTEQLSYGNYQRPLTELLQIRYDLQLPTIITTNLTPHQISQKYGERIADRLNEAAFVVPFLTPSYRGVETKTEPVSNTTAKPTLEPVSKPMSAPVSEPTTALLQNLTEALTPEPVIDPTLDSCEDFDEIRQAIIDGLTPSPESQIIFHYNRDEL